MYTQSPPQPNRSRTSPPGRSVAEQEQRRAQTLPSATKQIARNFRNRLERASALSREFFLNQNQILSHEIKNLFDSKQRDSLPPLACNHLWDSAAADIDGWERRKNRRKFPAVPAANSSAAKSLTLASVRATSATYAGSLRFPRQGSGARYGESVSIKMFSIGKTFAMS